MPNILQDEPRSPQFHAVYNYADGDLVLASKDGMHYRVHALILKMASSVFSDMLSIPRAVDERVDEPIPMDETSEVLSTMLDVIYPGRAVPDFVVLKEGKFAENSTEGYDRGDGGIGMAFQLAAAADKYGIPDLLVYVRRCVCRVYLSGSTLTTNDGSGHGPDSPAESAASATNRAEVQSYMLACHYGWEPETNSIPAALLDISMAKLDPHRSATLEDLGFSSPSIAEKLNQVAERSCQQSNSRRYFSSTAMLPSSYVSRIQTLQKSRRDVLYSAMAVDILQSRERLRALADPSLSHLSSSFYYPRDPTFRPLIFVKEHRQRCGSGFGQDNEDIVRAWNLLRNHIALEMEEHASGAGLRDPDFWSRAAFQELWSSVCGKCRKVVIDKFGTAFAVLQVLKSLPSTLS